MILPKDAFTAEPYFDNSLAPDGAHNYQPSQVFTPVSSFDKQSPNMAEAQPLIAGPSQTQSIPSDLACTIDPTAIQNRWLNAYLPDPDQRPKVPPAATNAFVGRMLKAYASATIRHGSPPPFLHEEQMRIYPPCPPLQNCFNLLKICNNNGPLSSNDLAVQLLEDEMARLYNQRASFNHIHLLAAFQAYLIYTITLYFHLGQQTSLRQHMMNLQQLASDTCAQGTVCTAELEHTRPKWSSWITVEAKRRSLYVMCLLDNLLSVKDGTPVYVASELKGLPAPASRQLWRASSDDVWKAAYNTHLAEWKDSGLRLDELWRPPADASELELERRHHRIDQWLEAADEYCTMLYAVTSGTHGE